MAFLFRDCVLHGVVSFVNVNWYFCYLRLESWMFKNFWQHSLGKEFTSYVTFSLRCVAPLGTDHYFLEGGGGWAISKKNCWKTKRVRGATGKKNEASAFYYPGPVFDFLKKFLRKLLPTSKKIMHNVKSCPRKLPNPPPPTFKIKK